MSVYMDDEIVIEDEKVVRLAEASAAAWGCTPEEAVYRALLDYKGRLDLQPE